MNEFDNKPTITSFFNDENIRNELCEFIVKESKNDEEERKKKGFINRKGIFLKKTSKIEYIHYIREQLRELGTSILKKLQELHNVEKEIDQGQFSFFDKKNGVYIKYNMEFFDALTPDLMENKVKTLIVFPSPTLSQLTDKTIIVDKTIESKKYANDDDISKEISGNDDSVNFKPKTFSFSNEIEKVVNEISKLDKSFQTIFLIPFFIGKEQDQKTTVLTDRSLMGAFLCYIKDIVKIIDPDIIIPISNPAFEKTINNFSEPDQRHAIRQGSSTFFLKLQESFQGKTEIPLSNTRTSKIVFCPHPFMVTQQPKPIISNLTTEKQIEINEKNERMNRAISNSKEYWEKTWIIISDLLSPKKLFETTDTNIILTDQSKKYFDNPKNTTKRKDSKRKLPKIKKSNGAKMNDFLEAMKQKKTKSQEYNDDNNNKKQKLND